MLAWASETRTAVIPRGAGSGVCGGAQAASGAVVIDLSRMDRVIDVDLVSQVVHVQAGLRGDRLEDVLAGHGLTVSHYPQSIAMSTIGGWIAASSAGQASAGFGAIEDVLLELTAVLPDGEILRCRPVPRFAAGPDLRRFLVGSEGTLAVVTEAALACRPRPAGWEWLAFSVPEFASLADGLREVVREPTGAAVIRGYDEADALLSFGSVGHTAGCVAILGFPSGLSGLPDRKRLAAEVIQRAAPAQITDPAYGAHWWQHRNDAVATYFQIMGPDRAFGPGTIVDTVEVAGLWSAVPELYAGVRAALAAHSQAVLCHLSHLYPWTENPRDAASRAIPVPVIPPPMTSTSNRSSAIRVRLAPRVPAENSRMMRIVGARTGASLAGPVPRAARYWHVRGAAHAGSLDHVTILRQGLGVWRCTGALVATPTCPSSQRSYGAGREHGLPGDVADIPEVVCADARPSYRCPRYASGCTAPPKWRMDGVHLANACQSNTERFAVQVLVRGRCLCAAQRYCGSVARLGSH